MLRTHRRLARHLATMLCVVALLLPAATSLAAEDPEEELEDVKRQLLDAREGVEDIDRRRGVTLEDLQRADAEVARLDANLAALQGELATAQHELEESEQRLAATTATLVSTEERLGRTHEEIRAERKVFADRTRAAFIYGGPTSMATMTVDAGDLAEFGRAIKYVEQVMASDRDRVTRISGLAREIEADTVELGVLQDRQASERAAAAAEHDRVADLVAQEQELRAAAGRERENRQLVLAELDADRETHLAMVSELEGESQRLEEELRRLAEEERRRQEEERRRQEEERRRQEEERRRQAEEQQREERERQMASRSGGRSAASSGGGSAASSGGGSAASSGGDASAAQAPASTGRMQHPAGGRISSRYGWRTHPIFGTRRFHAGVDFAAGHGSPIYAADDGVVVSAGSRGGYGLAVVIDHGGGLSTLYAHQSRFAVSSGQRVSRGQVIGYVGSTGYSTGPHLHFEVRVGGATRDPMGYL